MIMMEDKRIVDYFVICGVPETKNGRKYYIPETTEDPITDICVLNLTDHEPVPVGYKVIDKTPSGHEANLNHGSYMSDSMFLAVRRGRDKEPLKNIGVHFESTDKLEDTSVQVIRHTPSGFDANVNNSASKTYVTFQRSPQREACNQLVVTDICVILSDKNEPPPHAYMRINKNLNKGLFGSAVYLCYKLTHYEPKYLRYDPVIVDRYPLEDHSRFPIPDFLPHFCLPRSAAIQCLPGNVKTMSKPKSLSFVLTSEQADKLYVGAIWFYDRIEHNELNPAELLEFGFKHTDQKIDKKFFRTKSVCFVSRWPFLDQFKDFALFLVEAFGTENAPKRTLSLESYIYRFMEHIPFPKPDLPNICVLFDPRFDENGTKISDRTIKFSQTFDDLPFFACGASFEKLLLNLGPENCLFILLFALTEQKILLHTLRPGILAEVAEAITTIIFPFNWHCPYIPLCPMNLYSVVHAPLPFIIGIDSGYFEHSEPPDDVASIDLDTTSIFLSEKKNYLNLSILPKKELKQLKAKLDDLCARYSSNKPSSEDYQTNKRKYDIECQEAFLYFMASLLRDFKSYLKPITAVPKVGATDPTSLFDMNRFLKSRDSASQTFYKALLTTQMFTKFIEERCLVSDKNISLAFFDECVDKVERFERGLLKVSPTLIDIDDQQKSDKTHLISLEDIQISSASGQEQTKLSQTRVSRGIGLLDHNQFFMFHDKHITNVRKSFHSIGTGTSSSSGRDSIDSSTIDTDLFIYPLVKRTKYEIKKSSKYAERVRVCPVERAKHLLLTTYGLWFAHFPAFSHVLRESSIDSLDLAFQVLKRMHSMRFSTSDEFCYRILMVLCSVYNRPALAVKILLHTKKIGVSMNAITYGYYNKAVLESNWSENCQRNTNDRWKLLKNVFSIVNFMSKKMKKPADVVYTDSEPEEESIREKIDVEEQHKELAESNNQQDSMRDFTIKTIKDENIEAHIVVQDGESSKAETNSIKSEDSFSGQFSTRFTTPIKDVWTNMDLFSNKSKVGSTLRSSFRFAKTQFGKNKKEDFVTPTKISKSHTFEDGPPAEEYPTNSDPVTASAGTTPNIDRAFVPNPATNQSPWTGKHSEYVYSTFKSAANRINELKVQFASNSSNSPVKSQFLTSNLLSQIRNFSLERDDLGNSTDHISDSEPVLSKPEDVFNNLANYRDLFDSATMFYVGPILDPPEVEPKVALEIEMISSSICGQCEFIVYDEEIMSGWGASDSDMNSKCSKCGSRFVPNFTIILKDYRKSDGTVDSTNYALLEPMNLAYLSPMVLRKELESILLLEGYSCLLSRKFVDDHSIVYWNLLWYFQRINLPTHISGLALLAQSIKPDVGCKADELNYLNVKIVCRWDYLNFYEHESAIPKHCKWLQMKNTKTDSSFEEDVRQLLEKVREQDFGPAIRFLISKRVVTESKSALFPSIYRDLFFLSAIELDIPLDIFDKLYCDAFNDLSEKERELLQSDDSPPNVFTIFCRSLFKQLTLM